MEHPFLMFLDHTQRRSTVGRTPLDELITRPEESYRLCCVVVCDLETSRMGAPRSEEHTSELQSRENLVCRLLLEKKKKKKKKLNQQKKKKNKKKKKRKKNKE